MTSPARVRLAVILWLALGVVVWNVVFDRVLVLAGRRFVHDAAMADRAGGPYLLIKDYMPAAIRRGIWLGSAAGGSIVAVGLIAVTVARRRERSRSMTK